MAQGRDVDPLAVLEELEAADVGVLEEEDEAAGVGVGAEALDEIRPRAWRVVADFSPKGGAFRAMECLV